MEGKLKKIRYRVTSNVSTNFVKWDTDLRKCRQWLVFDCNIILWIHETFYYNIYQCFENVCILIIHNPRPLLLTPPYPQTLLKQVCPSFTNPSTIWAIHWHMNLPLCLLAPLNCLLLPSYQTHKASSYSFLYHLLCLQYFKFIF